MPLGTAAPAFDLPAANPEVDQYGGDARSLGDYADAEALVVFFTCNHCPYAVAVEDRVIDLAKKTISQGIRFIAICSNDAENYPEDSFENMAVRAKEKDFPFPYLHDESQEVARAYDAACTPDFYLFDKERTLVYRGRLDDGRPGQEATTSDFKDAIRGLLETGAVTGEQLPSMGCNIKWKE